MERSAASVAPPAPYAALVPLPPDVESETDDSDSPETVPQTAGDPLATTPEDVANATPAHLTEGWSAVVRRKPRQRQKRATKNEVHDAKTDTPDNTSSRSTRKQMAAGKARGTGLNVAQRQRFASVFVTGFTADVEAVEIREHVETCTRYGTESGSRKTANKTRTEHHISYAYLSHVKPMPMT